MTHSEPDYQKLNQLAEQLRHACLEAAREGFREASLSGLCSEGAMEAATGAIQSLDVEKIVKEYFP